MAKAVVFNAARPTYRSIIDHHDWAKDALDRYFAEGNSTFFALSPVELSQIRRRELEAQAQQDTLALLAFLEAEFRIDYLSRERMKLKDGLSKALIKVYHRKRAKAKLTDDIVKTWLQAGALTHTQTSHIHESLDFRNWLAHGQYWVQPNLKVRDFYELTVLVEGLINAKVFKVAP